MATPSRPGRRPARRTPAASGRARGPLGRWRALSPRTRRIVRFGLLGSFLGLVALVGLVYATAKIPKPDELAMAQTTVVSFADGSEMLRLRGEENRTDVPLADVPPAVRQAVLAAEDRTYYGHSGISLRGIARAAVHDVLGRGSLQGGSTITQQYARNAFLHRRRTVARKFREAIVAVKLDRTYSKDQVLEWYLNTIYFGRGAYGIEAASLTYFRRHARDLTVEQGALLAALIRSPEGGDPAAAPQLARRRWRAVLDGMAEEGWLDERRVAAARFPRVAARGGGRLGPLGFLRDDVYAELRARGFTADEIYTGGLRVTTTIDRKAQEAAVRAVAEVLTDPARDPHAALVAVEPGTGRIRALYGGRDYAKRQFNYATDGHRQPGSAYKPIVLATALREGIGLRSRFSGRSPQRFADYVVENFGGEQYGRVDLVDATAHSVNTVYVGLGLRVGVPDVLAAARDLGMPERVDCADHLDATLFLGSCEVRPVDLAAVFATFAAQGEQAAPHLVEEVRDRGGERRYRAKRDGRLAFPPDVMADATYAMTQVVERGTGRAAAAIGRPVAGKTGTTSDNTDAWFAGYVPQLATVVWMGHDPPAGPDGRPSGRIPPMRGLHGVREVTGGTLPAAVWARFMAAALEGVPVRGFPPPAFVGGRSDATTAPSAAPTETAVPTALPTRSTAPLPTSRPTGRPSPRPTGPATPPPATESPPPATESPPVNTPQPTP